MRLLELREEKNLTQQDVANAIKTSRTNIGRWEKEQNEPSASYIILLADFFEVSTDYLLGRENDFGTVNVKKELPGLSEEELQLIEDFRSLKPALREMLQATIQTWKGSKANAQERARRA